MRLAVILILLAAQADSGVADRFNRALAFHRKGALAEAEAEYRAVLAAAPNYAEAHANLGALLMKQDRYEEAVKEYETALHLAPQLKPVLLNIGIAHFRRSNYQRALTALQEFLKASPRHVQATQLTALALVELGRDEEAMKYLEPALEASPNDAALLYATGLAAVRLKKPMVSGIIKALAQLPEGRAISLLLSGQAGLDNFQFERAVEDLQEAAKLNPNLPRIHYSLGLGYFKVDRYEEARAAFENELRRNPKDVSSLCYLATMDEKEGRLDDAGRRLTAALSLEPGNADANWLMGKLLLQQGKAPEALMPLETAVRTDPSASQKRYQLARAYQQLGRAADAAREFAEVKRLQEQEMDKDRAKVISPR